MVTGSVNSRLEATVFLQLRGSDWRSILVEAVIDTGYTGKLTLPEATIKMLQPLQLGDSLAYLADGSSKRFPVYLVDVLWDGEIVQVVASVMGDMPLVGMGLLAGYLLSVDVRVGGRIQLKESTL